jgi:Asp-tRNA(Asn)/Glu-tRNA(Gln) amidotransferase A subunit family amidase
LELYELTIGEAHQLLKDKKISARELTRAVLDRIDAIDDSIGAFITVPRELAMQQADQADRMIADPWELRISSAPAIFGQPADPKYLIILFRPMMPPLFAS